MYVKVTYNVVSRLEQEMQIQIQRIASYAYFVMILDQKLFFAFSSRKDVQSLLLPIPTELKFHLEILRVLALQSFCL